MVFTSTTNVLRTRWCLQVLIWTLWNNTKGSYCLSWNHHFVRLSQTKYRETRTPHKTRGKLRCSWRVSSSCSISGTRRVTLATSPVISHEWGKEQIVITTNGYYPLINHLLSLIYGFWLTICYLWFTASDNHLLSLIYGFWLTICYLWFTASLVCYYFFTLFKHVTNNSWTISEWCTKWKIIRRKQKDFFSYNYHHTKRGLAICYLWFTASDNHLLSLIYGFWLTICYLWFTASD
jgi:hypothetical protein